MKTIPERLNILLVEDNPADQFLLEEMLASSRLPVQHIYAASRLQEAIALLQTHPVHLVLLDLSLPDSFGLDSLKSLSDFIKHIPVIILTGLADSEMALEALNHCAQDYLVKGALNSTVLVKSVEYSMERKKVEARILSSEEKYRQMFYQNPFPMWVNDMDSLQILEVNDAAILKYGYTREDFLALTLNDICALPNPIIYQAGIDGMQEKLWQHKKKNGQIILVEFTYYPVNFFGRTAMQAQVNDVTEKVRLESELALQKQKMIDAVLNAQEAERKSIGRDLHDNINQILTAIKLSLDLASEDNENSPFFLNRCKKNISTAIEEVRRLSKELIMSGSISELGIVNSIEELMKGMLHASGIQWHFSAKGLKDHAISDEQKLNLYRIVQEQLTNILKHAQARSINVALTVSPAGICLTITDDGKGFDPAAKRKGVGITNIMSRAELFNGQVTIKTAPGKGCSLQVLLHARQAAFDPLVLQVAP